MPMTSAERQQRYRVTRLQPGLSVRLDMVVPAMAKARLQRLAVRTGRTLAATFEEALASYEHGLGKPSVPLPGNTPQGDKAAKVEREALRARQVMKRFKRTR